MNLAEMIGGVTPGADVRLRQATVVGTPTGGTATLRFADQTAAAAVTTAGVRVETGSTSADDIAGVRCLDSAYLAAGDAVWVLQTGGTLLVIGKVGAATFPRGTLGYVATTTLSQEITGETDVTGLVVTVDVLAGRRLRVSGRVFMDLTTAAAGSPYATISEGAVQHNFTEKAGTGSGAGDQLTLEPEAILTPSAGSHTYKIRASGGGLNATLVSAGSHPAYIHVEDIGAA